MPRQHEFTNLYLGLRLASRVIANPGRSSRLGLGITTSTSITCVCGSNSYAPAGMAWACNAASGARANYRETSCPAYSRLGEGGCPEVFS